MAPRFGSPGVGMYGYNVCLINDNNGNTITQPDEKGVLMIEGPLPPGCLQTVWCDYKRFVNTYWTKVKDEKGKERWFYSTSDWA